MGNLDLEIRKKHRQFGGDVIYAKHASDVIGLDMTLAVFVPPNVSGPMPVLYYLSGLTCTEDNVTAKAGAARAAAQHGMLFVCPDTSPRGAGIAGEDDSWDFGTGAGFYVDATAEPWSTHYRMFSYVTEELPALVAANWNVAADRQGITGHSMGGHGALVCGLKRPDLYKSISAFAPIVAPTQVPWGHKAFAGYLGDDAESWKAWDACELVRRSPRPGLTILVDQGTADGFLEEQLRPGLFVEACEAAGQPLQMRMQDGYDHSYFFISTFIDDHIRHHA